MAFHKTRDANLELSKCFYFKLFPYHTCVLPDDGFVNKPKHVVTNYFM
jgi:hypothetical protein